jgi:hypothetical protein
MIMTSHELPLVLTADDQQLIERKLAELPQSADGSCTLSVFLPGARQVIVLLAQDGDIVSWCLMPAEDGGRAHALTVVLKHVLKCEHEIVCRDVKAFADAAIDRVSQTARQLLARREARHRSNDTYPGEWDCGKA